ncbi:NCS2 family permease [Virgibacillus halophilus]|uniref:NCS2 family permease n=1 Tax=Tigheibacillus halophilus TaxID=361280 RepID=A0ABU5C6Y3_9BACI|nr:NCS2 family permease [Virgibacillus halophilus]
MRKSNLLEKMFRLSSNNTNVRTEFSAGLTIFMTMLYVLIVVPGMLASAGIPKGTATVTVIIMTGVISIIMGIYSNRPFVLAPGLGSVAFLTVTLVVAEDIPWQVGMGMVFISGLLFVLFTVLGLRKLIVRLVPPAIKLSIGAGVGLFIALVGFRNAGLIQASEKANSLQLGDIGSPNTLLALLGFFIMSVLLARKVKGHLLIGIVIVTLVGIPMGVTKLPNAIFSLPESISPAFFQLDIIEALKWSYFPFLLAFFCS